MLAAYQGIDSVIALLLAKGFEVNARNADDESAMTRIRSDPRPGVDGARVAGRRRHARRCDAADARGVQRPD